MPKLELRSEWTTHPAPRSPIASNFQFHKYQPTKNAKMNNGYCDTKQKKQGIKMNSIIVALISIALSSPYLAQHMETKYSLRIIQNPNIGCQCLF